MFAEQPTTHRSAGETVEALGALFPMAAPELAFEAVVDGRDAAIGLDAAGQRLVIVSIDGSDRTVDLRSGGTIQRLRRNSGIEVRIETSGNQVTLFDLVDWHTAGMLIDVLRMRGFRSESPSGPPSGRARYPRLLPTRRRGVTVAAPAERSTR